jgi:hypothetical protein
VPSSLLTPDIVTDMNPKKIGNMEIFDLKGLFWLKDLLIQEPILVLKWQFEFAKIESKYFQT